MTNKRMPLKGAIGITSIIILLITTIGVSIHSKNLNTTISEQTSTIANLESEKEKLDIQISELIKENEQLKQETANPNITTAKAETASTSGTSLGQFRISAYCNCSKCCGKWAGGKTASGTTPTAGRTIAVDPSVIPLGTKVIIDGHTYVAEDTGGAIKGNRIDMYFNSHSEALSWGVKYKNVSIVG